MQPHTALDNHIETSYTDTNVVPNERVRYEVVAVAADVSSLPGRVALRANKPPLAGARFDGVFNVEMVAIEWSSSIVRPTSHEEQFIFKAQCPLSTWSCDSSWDEFYGSAEGTLARRGVNYSGRAFGTLNLADCETGTDLDQRLDIDITVLGAGGDDWLVDDFKGTLREAIPGSGGCPAASVTWRFAV